MASSSAFCPVRWLVVGSDHPALPGHFPGEPIVPGVVLLDYVVALLQETVPAAVVQGIPVAKFLKPVQPDVPLLLGLDPAAAGQMRFVCRVRNQVMARGVLQLRDASIT